MQRCNNFMPLKGLRHQVDACPQALPPFPARDASFSSTASTATGGPGSSCGSSPSRSLREVSFPGAYDPHLAVAAPGDVLCVMSSEKNVGAVGAIGGSMGHVLLVTSETSVVPPGSPEAQRVGAESSHRRVHPLVRVSIMESTREVEGLQIAELYMHVDEFSGEASLIGEYTEAGGYVEVEESRVEVWRAPLPLRELLSQDLMAQVLCEMRGSMASWSMTTAVRAVLRSAEVSLGHAPSAADASRLLRELQAAWQQEPICTSVVINFWQRYLWAWAGAGRPFVATNLILEYMPLMADRALPTELRAVLKEGGWQVLQNPVFGRLPFATI